ncbi:MAG: hypothetical protein ABID38_06135 [Candidatus Diapherotrites archaeon]
MGNKVSEEDMRFSMVKVRHRESFEKALGEGKVDKQLQGLCKFIAKTRDYFTSSGCAGRILLLGIPEGGGKKETYFHEKWHRKVSFNEIWKGIEKQSKGELWFKMEPFILHIGCKGLKDSKKILSLMKSIGIKRGGIMVAKEGKFIVEFTGTQQIALPVKKGGKILIDREYMGFLLDEGNRKLAKNYLQLKTLEKECKKVLK